MKLTMRRNKLQRTFSTCEIKQGILPIEKPAKHFNFIRQI